jgi:hypothetical protein
VGRACGWLVWMMISNAALGAAALGAAVRVAHMPRRVAIGAGLLTGGALVALAHIVGADLRGVSGGQPGLLLGLFPDGTHEEPRPLS